MKAQIRGAEIYFDIDGAGLVPDGEQMVERPKAFIISGGPGQDHAIFKARYKPLTERMQLVYFDQRGHGRSSRHDPAQYNLDENVEDMEELRRYLGLGPIVSIGTSYGGMVAMAHAARYPESVSHLILLVTAAHGAYADRALEIAHERGTAEQRTMAEAMFSGLLDTREKLTDFYQIMGPLYARQFDPALQAAALKRVILTPEPFNQAHAPDGFLRTFDLRPELSAIIAPTLIIGGRHDWICAPEFSEEIHRLIPGSDLRIFGESSHSLAGDEPRNFFDVINGFLPYR